MKNKIIIHNIIIIFFDKIRVGFTLSIIHWDTKYVCYMSWQIIIFVRLLGRLCCHTIYIYKPMKSVLLKKGKFYD